MSDSESKQLAVSGFAYTVQPWLRSKVGFHLSELIREKVLQTDFSSFVELLDNLVALKLKGYGGPVLSMFLDKEELSSIKNNLELDFLSFSKKQDGKQGVELAFSEFLAPYLRDILGALLVQELDSNYRSEVGKLVGLSDKKKFLQAMGVLQSSVPLLEEVEFKEKIVEVADKLSDSTSEEDVASGNEAEKSLSLDEAVKQIVVPDLVDILGAGPIMDSLLDDCKSVCRGMFADEESRFVCFIDELGKQDLISDMFGDHWIGDKKKEWLSAFKELGA